MREDLLTQEQRVFLQAMISAGRCKGTAQGVYEILSDVTDVLSSERTRREEAEHVVDTAYRLTRRGDVYDAARDYLIKYPRDPK